MFRYFSLGAVNEIKGSDKGQVSGLTGLESAKVPKSILCSAIIPYLLVNSFLIQISSVKSSGKITLVFGVRCNDHVLGKSPVNVDFNHII